jgi:hypothetical protein
MRTSFNILLSVLLLLSSCSGLNWQGAGNFSSSNLTDIWNYISSHFSVIADNKTAIVPTITDFSTYLNGLWDPAWSVVLVYDLTEGVNLDSVLYGYAYNNHWMWSNGILLSNGNYVSIIIWKDYNCYAWRTIVDSSTTTFNESVQADI